MTKEGREWRRRNGSGGGGTGVAAGCRNDERRLDSGFRRK